jgi:hypothetical protein
MKHLRILVLTLSSFLVSISLSAQSSGGNMTLKYFNKTGIGTAIGIGSFKGDIDSGSVQRKLKNDQMIFPIQTINGFILGDRVGIGLGLGIEFWKEGLFFPVFGHLSCDLKKSENTFYGILDIGTAIGTRKETSYYASGKGGTLFSLGAGYRMTISKRLQFGYEVFYRYQAIDSHYTVYLDAARTKSVEVDEKFPYHFAGFKIGIIFK